MKNKSPEKIAWQFILPLVLCKLILHFFSNTNYGLHRDEFLYIAEGEHLSWGYMEVPPMIAILGKITTTLLGNTTFAVRFLPAVIGAISIILLVIMVRDLGGKKYAQLIAGSAFLFSPAFLGSNTLFQPVSFNQFCWLLSAFLVVKIIQYEQAKFWYFLGIVAGVGFLTKYSILFFFIALIGGFLLTPKRKVFITKYPWVALGIATLIALPNILWQIQHNLPVVRHMQELAATQLVNMTIANFLLPQLLFHFAGLLVWIMGLVFFFRQKYYRVLAWTYVFVILLFLVFGGKAYYTIGAYSMLFAGGAIWWEQQLKNKSWMLVPLILVFNLSILPYVIPILSLEKMQAYGVYMRDHFGLSTPLRWEDGKIRNLPQDYADMHGWEEMVENVAHFYHQLPSEVRENTFLYGGNYGHAGALNFYRKKYDLPETYSFSSSFIMWCPEDLNFEHQLQVEDDYINPSPHFEQTELVDSTKHIYARDPGYIYFKSKAKGDLSGIWKEIVQEQKREVGY